MTELLVRAINTSPLSVGATATVQCWPALWPIAVAHATWRPGGRPTLTTAAIESAMLLSHLDARVGHDLRTDARYLTAPPHLARSVTESAALAVTADLGRVFGWSPAAPVVNVDEIRRAEPAWGWLRELVPPGPRPDLLLGTPAGLIAAESRGRSFARRPLHGVGSTQTSRVAELDAWANAAQSGGHVHVLPKWYMCWLWLDDRQARADLFDPGEPLQLREDQASQLTSWLDRRLDAMFAASRDDQLELVAVGSTSALVATQRIGAREDGRVEWLSLFLAAQRWVPAVTGPSTARYTQRRDFLPLEQDVDVAMTDRLAAVLSVTEGYEQPNRRQVIDVVAQRLR